MSLFSLIKRFFRSYGHGVHSPLAYRIIRECLQTDETKYAYYADVYARRECRLDVSAYRCVLFLSRLVALMHPRCVWIPGKEAALIRRCLSEYYPELDIFASDICPKNADFIVAFKNKGVLRGTVPSDGPHDISLLVVPAERGENPPIAEGIQPTLILRSRRFSLFCRRKNMARVEYDIL